jgi:hypothetical protein
MSKNAKIKICKIIILPVIFYGFKARSLIFREERRQRVFEKGVLRRIFGPKGDEIGGGRRKL